MLKCKYGFYTCSFIGQVDFCNTCDDGQNYQMKKETRGGKRKGAGAKPLPYKTKPVGIRVPVTLHKEIVAMIREYIKSKLTTP